MFSGPAQIRLCSLAFAVSPLFGCLDKKPLLGTSCFGYGWGVVQPAVWERLVTSMYRQPVYLLA